MKLKDEIYFEKRNARLMKKDPIRFMGYVASEMLNIAKYERNKKQMEFYTVLHLLVQKKLCN